MHTPSTLALCLMALLSLPSAASSRPATDNVLTAGERRAGWQLLFDGRDLKGWGSLVGGAPAPVWKVRNGILELTATSGEMGGGDLVTTGRYGAFELTVDWKVQPGGNSGILYLARPLPQTRHVYETGLEMQVLDDATHSDGKIPSHRAGALYDFTVPPAGASRPAGQWNHARLLVERGRIRQWLNGVPTADMSYGDDAWRNRVAQSKFAKMPFFGTFPNGVIALQDHGAPVAFRNIKLRPIADNAKGP